MTTLEQTCRELHQRYEHIGNELTQLELKLVAPGFQTKEAASGKARELHEEVKVLRLRHDEGLRRVNEMHAATGADFDRFVTEVSGMADDLEVRVQHLTAAWTEAFGDESPDQAAALRESAAKLSAATTD
ncbi:hypothetical protein GC176_26185 [bacterium]|nr:hypothetical protein [bacterium]